MEAIKLYIKNNIVLFLAVFVAFLTSLIIKPDKQYMNYLDYRTLTCLFCMLSVICSFNNINFFEIISCRIISIFRTTRTVILALVYITLIGSMLITNDMALIVFLPMGFFVLNNSNQSKNMAFTFIMQNFAANLGGMLTPFGNPQNFYLFSYFNIGTLGFLRIMFLPFVVSIFLISICCMFVKDEPLILRREFDKKLNVKKTIICSMLFVLGIAIVFRSIPCTLGLCVILPVLLIMDKKALTDVDYGLLLTFCAFFVFSGNVSRIPSLSSFLNYIMEKDALLSGVTLSQFISNVPSAVLLSKFTTNYRDLLVAVNIGGVGTLIASLASLITFREYIKHNPGRQWHFIKLFSVYNFGFLVILTLFCSFIK